MLVTLICEDRLYEVLLPEKVGGRYWIEDYELETMNLDRRILSIEEVEGVWQTAFGLKLEVGKLYAVELPKGGRGYLFTESYTKDRCALKKYSVNSNVTINVGSSPDNQVAIANPYVSPVHAQLSLSGNTWTLYDNNSENGIKEGRLAYAGAAPGAAVSGIADTSATDIGQNTGLVPLNKLANLSSLRKNATNAELAQAYAVASQLVTPYIGLSRQEQLRGIMGELRYLFETQMMYSMSAPHYNDPYGYFVLHTASCAGCARATGLCLNMLGISYEHVNPNQYTHQWCRVDAGGEYWICDVYGLYCGPEPAPYTHPYF